MLLSFCYYEVAYVIITMALIKHGIGVQLLIHLIIEKGGGWVE